MPQYDTAPQRLGADELYDRLTKLGWDPFRVQRVSEADIRGAAEPDPFLYRYHKGLEAFFGTGLFAVAASVAASASLPPVSFVAAAAGAVAATGFATSGISGLVADYRAHKSGRAEQAPSSREAAERAASLDAQRMAQGRDAEWGRRWLGNLNPEGPEGEEALLAAMQARLIDPSRQPFVQMIYETLDKRFEAEVAELEHEGRTEEAAALAEKHAEFRDTTSFSAARDYAALVHPAFPPPRM